MFVYSLASVCNQFFVFPLPERREEFALNCIGGERERERKPALGAAGP